MELFPIIIKSLIIFSIVSGIIIIISFVSYKVRKNIEKGQKEKAAQPQAQKPVAQQNYVQQQAVPQAQPVHQAQPVQHAYNEQNAQAQQRKKTIKVQKVPVRPVERFQVVNQQQNDFRMQMGGAVEANKPFYHPRTAESKRQIVSRKSFSLYDNYSSGGEKLHKLNLAPNFS